MDLVGKKVWVYRNLKHGRNSPKLYSVVYNGKVVARVNKILLHDCKFIVRQGGYNRFKKTGKKNVHAFVVGTVINSICGIDKDILDYEDKIEYNPSRANYFYLLGPYRVRVNGAANVLLNQNGISGELLEEE